MVLSDSADGFRIPRSMMLLTGLWPSETKSWTYRAKTITSWVTMVTLSITMLIELYTSLYDLSKVSKILYIFVTFLSAIIKQASFFYYEKSFVNVLNHLKNPLFTSHPEEFDYHMVKTIKEITVLANTYRYSVGCCVILMGVFPILDNKPLPFPFSYDFGNYRFLMYAFQLLCLSISAWNNSCLDSLCISLMGIASANLDILMKKICYIKAKKDFCDDNLAASDDELVSAKLKVCVEHHLAIIELVEYIEKIFNVGIFGQFLASGIVICNVLFHFVLISASMQVIMLVNYLIIILMQLFFYCWYGNKIIYKSEEILNACYTFNWYDYGTSVRQYVFLIMERSKRPLCVKVLKFTSASLKSLTSILSWSYSLLTLLLQMYKKRL